MAMVWSGAADGPAEHELEDIEVDEVSLVDRPATGRRFVLFKRGPRRRPAGEEENKCSRTPADEGALEALAKRAESLQETVRGLEDGAARLEERLARLEDARAARQSEPGTPRRESLWSGLL